MMSEVLEFVDPWKTQKSKYFEKKTFFSSLKGYIIAKNNILAESTLNLIYK